MTHMTILAHEISRWRESKGFVTPSFDRPDMMLGKLMLIVTEVAEAAEAVRKSDEANFWEEIADTFIRLLDICAAGGIDPEAIIQAKMLVNHDRPYRHGKVTSL